MVTGNSQTAVGPTWHPLPNAFRKVAAAHADSVLLETAKPDTSDDRSLLFLQPEAVLTAGTAGELDSLLADVDRHLSHGRFVAGYFTYESGEGFVGLHSRSDAPSPLVWLGVYSSPVMFHHRNGEITGRLPNIPRVEEMASSQFSVESTGLEIAEAEYLAKIARVQEYLLAGDTYQVNFTDRITGSYAGAPLALYEELLKQQPVSFAALVNQPDGSFLSLSPELFYRTTGGRITARPMKGTWPRGLDLSQDLLAAEQLRNDPKNRGEHVTIVDLLRNDLGRVCKAGSVKMDALFNVERYRTLLQMTSTISGVLRSDVSPTQVFRSLFPSGSITGAPKRRTMEIIRELECHPRGVYTGAIGYFAPGGEACFNVAIRTLDLKHNEFVLGVGGGITADSRGEEEYEECRLKGRFLTHRRPAFSLIETMRCESGITLLPQHMERLCASAEYFDIRFDIHALRAELQQTAAACGDTVSCVRLVLDQVGKWSITATPLEEAVWSGRILLSLERTLSDDVFLRHKTTNRELYEQQFAAARRKGFDEALFLNERGELTEGAISNVFVRVGERWLTPALSCGVLPGLQRALLLQQLQAEEATLTLAEFQQADEVLVCNALRGVRYVRQLEGEEGAILWRSA